MTIIHTTNDQQGDLLVCRNGSIFQLLSELGRGGMAVVYLAKRFPYGKKVAVKLATGAVEKEAIENEAEILRSFANCRLNRLLDSGETINGDGYLALKYVDGQSLDQYILKRGALSIQEGLNIVSQLLAALGIAHRKGIVHRDIKPANILISGSGRNLTATLIDFGISSSAASAVASRGSLAYMSPEQLCDSSITPQSDLYQLGLVLFECLHGKLPFESKTDKIIQYKFIGKTLPNWCRVVNSVVWQAVYQLIEELLLVNPERRIAYPDLNDKLKMLMLLTAR